jgi:Family of unknown function (DUF6788)
MSPEQKIAQIKSKIINLGPMLPGSISEQWNVCGTPGCMCKSAENPIKHGPYYQLSFSVKGRSSSMFIRKQDINEARRRIKRYQELKKLLFELVQAYVDLARIKGFERS